MDIKTINREKIIKIAKQYLTVANVSMVLLGVTLWVFLAQAWQLYQLYQVTSHDNIEQLTDISQPMFNTDLDDDILELFGHYRLDENIVTQETALPLVLKGVFYTEDEINATAFIAYSGQEEQAYGKGAMLPDNVELYSIQSDHVILYHKNRFERLGFAETEIFADKITQPIAGELNSSEPAYNRIIDEDLSEYNSDVNNGWFDGETNSDWFDDETNSAWLDDEADNGWFDGETNSAWLDDEADNGWLDGETNSAWLDNEADNDWFDGEAGDDQFYGEYYDDDGWYDDDGYDSDDWYDDEDENYYDRFNE